MSKQAKWELKKNVILKFQSSKVANRPKSILPEEADKFFALPYIIEASFSLPILYVQILIQLKCEIQYCNIKYA